jgi:hypothetical protein
MCFSEDGFFRAGSINRDSGREHRLSLRAEIVRLGLRWFVKRRSGLSLANS